MKTTKLTLILPLILTITACSQGETTKPQQSNHQSYTEEEIAKMSTDEKQQKTTEYIDKAIPKAFSDVEYNSQIDDYNVTINLFVKGAGKKAKAAMEGDDAKWEKVTDKFNELSKNIYEYATRLEPDKTVTLALLDDEDKFTTLIVSINNDVVYEINGE